jgi:hypothetical protein
MNVVKPCGHVISKTTGIYEIFGNFHAALKQLFEHYDYLSADYYSPTMHLGYVWFEPMITPPSIWLANFLAKVLHV